MRVSSLLAVFSATGGLALSPLADSPGRISLGQVANPNYKKAPLAVAVASVYSKYKLSMPKGLASAVERHGVKLPTNRLSNGTGTAQTVPARLDYDIEYLTQISIGTPPQTLPLCIDTGSSDLWVFSTLTPKDQVNGQVLYNPNASTTASWMNGSSWYIFYGDGSGGSGTVYKDVVSFGNLSFPQQAVQVAESISYQFTKDSNTSGIMGLGFPNGNTVLPKPQLTFFDNINSSLELPVFTADLKPHLPGTYNFGFIDHTAYIGNISYSHVDDSQPWWLFNMSGFAIGNSTFHKAHLPSIADTGSSVMMMDSRLVKLYWTQVPGAKFSTDWWGYTYPCNTTLPDLVLGTNTSHTQVDQPLRIPGFLLEYGLVQGNDTSLCIGALQSGPPQFSILGDSALKAAFVVHEKGPVGKSRIGFANKNLSRPAANSTVEVASKHARL